MTPEASPSTSPPTEDVGAETANRFAYQEAWTAITACSLLEKTPQFVELYCEHHEDILLKRADGKFQGIQVKTRNLAGDHWKTDDDAVYKSLCRFSLLDSQFPDKFSGFVFATNHFFYQASKTGKNLPYVLAEAAQTANIASASRTVKSVVKKIALDEDRTPGQILATLKKTGCNAELPKLNDIQKILRETIVSAYPPAQDCIPTAIARAAEQLMAAIHVASSLQHLNDLPAYLCLCENHDEIETQQRIESKRFTAERVRKILETALRCSARLVPAHCEEVAPHLVLGRLARKLEAGGLGVVSINMATDLRAAALHQCMEWKEKYGESEALRRYEHLKTLVLMDCASAYEETKNDSEPFGRKMLEALRERLNTRFAEVSRDSFEGRKEHLEGCAYELTGACKVWWSPQFNLNEG